MSIRTSFKLSLDHCKEIVKRLDHESYVWVCFLPRNIRSLGFALSALNAETASIKATSQNSDICSARMLFWENAILGVINPRILQS